MLEPNKGEHDLVNKSNEKYKIQSLYCVPSSVR